MISAATDYERLFRLADEAMLILDPEAFVVIDMNRSCAALLNAPEEVLVGRPATAVVPHDDEDFERIRSVATTGRPQRFESEFHDRQASRQLQVSVMRAQYRGRTAVVCSYNDVTGWREKERQLTEKALHDPLTKLANRTLFFDRLDHALLRLDRHSHTVAMILIDLNDFKHVNDGLGHAAGDQVLVEAARRIAESLRDSDTAARLGGDEFGVLLDGASYPQDAIAIAGRISAEIARPFYIDAGEVLHLSIGIAGASEKTSAADLMAEADAALYEAKKKEGSAYEVFARDDHRGTLKRSDLRADICRAVECDELDLEFQPIFELASGDIVGVEALARWNHPEQGRIAPGVFIPVSESVGSISDLGRWVLEHACIQGAEWLDMMPEQPLLVSVNVSDRQIRHGRSGFAAVVASVLERTGFPAEALVLEVTEASLDFAPDATLKVLNELRELGVRIALDDFGSGPSSIRSLQRFPIDIVKIDRPLASSLSRGRHAGRMAKAIVALGNVLEIETIAEGVSSAEQLYALRELGCALGQGYHLGRPMQSAELRALLQASRTSSNGSVAG